MSLRGMVKRLKKLERVFQVGPFYVLKTVFWDTVTYLVMGKGDIKPWKLKYWQGPFPSRLEANRFVWQDIKSSRPEMREKTLRYYSEEQLQNESGEMISSMGVWCRRRDQSKINKAELQRLNKRIEKLGREKVLQERVRELIGHDGISC